jgi:hypothetical protein
MDGSFDERYREWEKELKDWYKEYYEFEGGKKFGEVRKSDGGTYEDWAGDPPSPPNPYDYMPNGAWYQLFENVSEGTPLSPPFETKQALIDWLSSNKDFWGNQWSKESAEFIVEQGFALSGIMSGGKYYKPEEQYLLKHQ